MTYTPFKYRQLSDMILIIQLRPDFKLSRCFLSIIMRAIYNFNHAQSFQSTVLYNLFYSCSMQLSVDFNSVLLFA